MPSEYFTLQNRQAALINTIFSAIEYPGQQLDKDNQGLRIYQNNLLMTATKALSLNYPVIEQMLGQKTMLSLTRYLLRIELPNTGDWADFGQMLPTLLTKTPLHQEHPYLRDTAELEWLLGRAARSAPTELDISSLTRLSATDLGNVYLKLAAGLGLLKSQYPIEKLWRLHHRAKSDQPPRSSELIKVLSESRQGNFYLIYQKEHLPCIKPLTEQEYQWFASINSGFDLASLFEQHPGFDFSHWLSLAIEQHWLRKLS